MNNEHIEAFIKRHTTAPRRSETRHGPKPAGAAGCCKANRKSPSPDVAAAPARLRASWTRHERRRDDDLFLMVQPCTRRAPGPANDGSGRDPRGKAPPLHRASRSTWRTANRMDLDNTAVVGLLPSPHPDRRQACRRSTATRCFAWVELNRDAPAGSTGTVRSTAARWGGAARSRRPAMSDTTLELGLILRNTQKAGTGSRGPRWKLPSASRPTSAIAFAGLEGRLQPPWKGRITSALRRAEQPATRPCCVLLTRSSITAAGSIASTDGWMRSTKRLDDHTARLTWIEAKLDAIGAVLASISARLP